MSIVSTKRLHYVDLDLAKRMLISLQESREMIFRGARDYAVIIRFWDCYKWPWHQDVPDDRMYRFTIHDHPDQEYSDMIEWVKSEIRRVEGLPIIWFYQWIQRYFLSSVV